MTSVGSLHAQVDESGAPAVDSDIPPFIYQAPNAPALFGLDDEILVTVWFTRNVRVTGTPRIALDIGGVTRHATFHSVGGPGVVFVYRVQAGDLDTDGLDIVADSLELNGGTIKGTGDRVDAVLDHPTQASTDTRRPVDGVAPTVTLSGSNIQLDGPDDLVTVGVVFSEPVTGLTLDDFAVTNGSASTLTEDTTETAGTTYALKLKPNRAGGTVTVQLPADSVQDAVGIDNAASSAHSIRVGIPANIDPGAPPFIFQSPGSPAYFGLYDDITVIVTFTKKIVVTGTPRLALDIGGDTRYANFQSAGGPLALFTYSVQASDEDRNGLDIVADSLELNGGTIVGTSDNRDALLAHPSQAATDIRRRVDGIIPTVTLSGPGNSFQEPDQAKGVSAVFSEPVTGLTLDDFTVTNGTASNLAPITYVTAGTAYLFEVLPDGEGALTVDLPAGAVTDAGGNGNTAAAQLRLLVGDPATVTITPKTSNPSEGRAVKFELLRSKDNGERTVQVQVSQTGDYLAGDTSFGATITTAPVTVPVTFLAGETSLTLTLDTDDDYVPEDDGSVTLTVLEDPTEVGYLLGTPSAATATVRDNDPQPYATVSGHPVDPDSGVAYSGTQLVEGRAIQYTVVRSRLVGEQTLDLQISQQGDFLAASHPDGLTVPADGRIQITFGATSLWKTFRLNTVNDAITEDDGSVTLTVLPRAGDPLYPTPPEPETMEVLDDDAPPTINVSAEAESVEEGAWVGFTVTRTNASDEHERAIFVQLEMIRVGDFLYAGSNVVGPTRVSLKFDEGDFSKRQSFQSEDDQVSESDGAFILRVLPAAAADAGAYLVGAPDNAVTIIKDNDPPLVSITPVAATVTEGTDVEFRISRSGSTTQSLNVPVNLIGHRKIMTTATETLAYGGQSALADTLVTIDAGATEATLTLTTQADRVNEGDGEITASIKRSPEFLIEGTGSASVLVQDDDIPEVTLKWLSPTLTLKDDVWVGEIVEGTAIDYEVECSGNTLAPSAANFHVFFELDDVYHLRVPSRKQELLNHPIFPAYNIDNTLRLPCSDQLSVHGLFTAHRGSTARRYTGPDEGEILIDLLPQQLQVSDSIAKYCFLDSVYGAPRDIRFCPKFTLGAHTSARITVLNRNPTITVEALADSVIEGEPARFRLKRIWNEENLDFHATAFGLTTAATGNYITAALPSGTRTFAAGEAEIIIEIPTENDMRPRADGSVTLELLPGLSETQALNIGGTYVVYDRIPGVTPAGKSSRTATVEILNDDMFPLISVPDASAEEGYPVELTVTLSDAHSQGITVDWSVADGTAVVGEDYSEHAGGTLTFAPGATEQTISVTTLEDRVPEEDETFSLVFSNPVRVSLPVEEPVGTITNDDMLPIVTVTAQDTPIAEGNSPWFVVSRQGFSDHRLEVTLSLTKDGVDMPDRIAAIPFGEMSHTFRVNHVDTYHPSKTEFVYVTTINELATDYVIGTPGSATVTVLNDDVVRGWIVDTTVSPKTFDEAGDVIQFTYTLESQSNTSSGFPVTVHSKLFGEFELSSVAIESFGIKDFSREYTVTEEDVAAGIVSENWHADDGILPSPLSGGFASLATDFKYILSAESTFDELLDDENRGPFNVDIRRVDNNESSHDVRLYTVNGSAHAGTDYTAVDQDVTFAHDERKGFYISIADDLTDEPSEYFEVFLVDADDSTKVYGYLVLSIDDNDPAVVPHFTNNHRISPSPGTNESWPTTYGDFYVTVELHRELADSTTVATTSGKTVEFTYQTVDGTAKAGEDYSHVSGRISIPPGSDKWSFRIPIIDDSIYEGAPPETFSVELSDAVNIDLPDVRAVYTIEIEDDDDESAQFILAVDPSSVTEDAGATTVTVTATVNEGALTEDTDVTISVVDATATAGSDFEAVSDFTLTIPADELSGTATFTLTPIDDGVIETYRELFRVTGSASDLTAWPTNGVTLQILDDDERGVMIDPTALPLDEGQTDTYSVVLTSVPTGRVTVTPSVPADAPVTISPATLTFTADDWDDEQTVTVSAAEDVDAEDEVATVSHTVAGADYGGLSADAVAVTVADDETPSTKIELRAAPTSIAEGGGDRTITVTAALDGTPLADDITVEVDVGSDTATQVSDFAAVDSFELTITAGNASASGTFTLSPVDDDVDEGDETLSITGQVVAAGTPVAGALPVMSAALTIQDDDTRGVVVTPTTLTVEEDGRASYTREYTIVLTSAPSQDAFVDVVVPASADLSVSPTRYIFTNDDWSDAQTVTITALKDDDLTDDPVTLTHTVTGGDYTGIAVSNVTVTITEPTSAPMTVDDAREAEGSGPLEFEVALEWAVSEEATVQYRTVGMTSTNGVTAKAGEDFTDTSGTLTFAAGETQKTIRVTLLDDALNEAEEYFELVLESPVNAELPTSPAHTVKGIIEDDDPLPVVSVVGSTVDGWSHGEESKEDLSFTVSLSAASSREVTVDYATKDQAPSSSQDLETATASEDYTSLSGRLTYAAGETEKTLTVMLTDDDVGEDDEAFSLQLSNPVNAVLGDQGWGLIRDDDFRGVVLNPSSLELQEGQSKTYTVALASQPTDTVTVTLTPSAGVQTNPTSLSFQTDEWDAAQTVTVISLQDDDAVDASESVRHSFAGGNFQDFEADDLPITIEDDDTQGIEISTNSVTIPEGETQTYTVKLTSEPTATVTVAIGATLLTKAKTILTDVKSIVTGRQANGTDLSLEMSSLKFTKKNWDEAQEVKVTAASDSDAKDEAATLVHKSSGGDYDPVPASLLRAEIHDDETASTKVTLTVDVASVDEDAGATTVTVTGTLDAATRLAATTVTVAVGASDDTATEGTDYATVADFTLTIDAGETSGMAVFSLTPTDDDIDEDRETLSVSGTTTAQELTVTGAILAIDDESSTSLQTDGDTRGVTVSLQGMTVPEGGSNTYTVVLDSEPTADVTVTPSRTAGSSPDVTFSPASLTFTTGNWDTAQTVTVSAAEDADAEADAATIEHAVAGGDYGSNSVTASDVAVTVNDNETASTAVALTVDVTSVDEAAGATTVTVTGTLDGAPFTSATSVAVAVGASGDAAAEGTDYATVADVTLTIDADQASGTATFSLTPTNDDVDEGDEALSVSGTVAAATGLSVTGTTVTIEDDDERGVTVTPTSLTVAEGGGKTYTVVLDSEPTADVTVTPSRTAGSSSDVTLDKTSLTFTTGNWDTAQTVTVSAAEDADAEADAATIEHAVAGGDYGSNGVTASDVAVTVNDNETASTAVTLTVDVTSVDEAAGATTVTVTGTLDGAPFTSATSVTVAVGVSGDAAAEGTDYSTVADVTLTIAADQTSGTATFTLAPVDDDVDEGDEALSVTGTVTGLSVTGTTVTIEDDDERGVTVTPTSLTVAEGGGKTYTVVLDSEPTADVTVTPSRTAGSSPDVTFSPASLTFTTGNWDTAQTVTVSAAEDADAEADAATIEHAVAGGDYGSNSVTASSVAVTVNDNETASTAVALTVDVTSVDEAAGATTVTVTGTLDGAPFTSATSVTVAVGASGDAAAEGTDYSTINDVTLTIAADQTSGTAVFTLAPVDDDVDEADEALSVTGTAAAAGLSVTGTTVTIEDDDERGVTVTPTSLTVAEGGSKTYTVVLDSEPTADVTVTPSRTAGSSPDVTLDKSSLTFTTGNWDTAQTVTVSAAEDADAEADAATIEHAVAGGDYGSNGVTASDVAVTVNDNETASTAVALTVDVTAVDEAAGATTVTVTGTLDGAPFTSATSVTVAVGASGDAAAEGTDYATVADVTLTIDADQTSGTATFTLAPVDDDVDEGDEALSVTGTAAAATGLSVTGTTVTIEDDDERGVTVTPTSLTVAEGGGKTYTVVLDSEPTADVTVTPSRTAGSSPDVTFSPASLSFTADDWDTAQTVTVSAAEDADAEADAATIEHAVAGGDYGSNGVTASDVAVTVNDNETASTAVTLTVDVTSVDEAAGATTVTVTGTLDSAPLTSATSVTVAVGASGDAAAEGTDYATVADVTLTIDADQTSGTATFSLAPTNDDVDEADEALSVTGTVTGLSVTGTTVTVEDDDERGVTVTPTSLTVAEGGGKTYTVVLNSEPTADVTVTPSRTAGSSPDVTLTKTSLTFTTGNWDTAQTVTVSAAEDADAEADAATIEHAVAGGDYGSNGVTASDVAVTVNDNETASTAVTLTVDVTSVDEAAAATTVTVTGTLDGAPFTSATIVTVSVGATSDAAAEGTDYATVADVTLTIDADQTSGTATFSLAPTNDDVDEGDEALSVAGTATGLSVTGTTVTIEDDDQTITEIREDERGVTVTPTRMTVSEGGSRTYTIVLESQPTAGVTVTPSVRGSRDVRVSPSSLSFTADDWNDEQTVTVSAAHDVDAEEDTAIVAHAVSGGDYGSVTASDVGVTIVEDETASTRVTLTADPGSIEEDADGTSVTVTGTLDEAPFTSATLVTISVGASSDTATEGTDYSTVDAFTLTIAAYETSGTATFSLVPTNDDLDEEDEALSVTGTTAGLTVTGTRTTIVDDDTRGVTVWPMELTLPEGSSSTYTVVLESQPTADVTVTPSVRGSRDVRVSPPSLSFTASTWGAAQTVTVSAAHDVDAEEDTAIVAHAVSGGDYGSVTASDVGVTIVEDETASTRVTLTVDPGSIEEDADRTSVTVTGTLDEAPFTSATLVTISVGASSDTATEGTDYSVVDDFTLTIAAFETSGTATFSLTPIDDAVDEEAETITVSGGTQGLSVEPATITIANVDPLPRAWLARFGRSVAEQILEAVENRMTASRRAGVGGRLAGQSVGGTVSDLEQANASPESVSPAQRLRSDALGWHAEEETDGPGVGSRALTERDLLEGSSFALTRGSDETGYAAVWSEGSVSRFEANEDGLPLEGDVTTGMVGADWMHEDWMAGLVLSLTQSEGEWTISDFGGAGQIAASIIGFWPWGQIAIDDRISVWGLLGRGQGDISLTPSSGDRVKADMDMTTAAIGLHGVLLTQEESGGLELSATSDALAVWSNSDMVRGMRAARTEVTRIRLGLEGNLLFDMGGGATLGPEFELGLRRDGGDAETGMGIDVGAGIVWTDPGRGLQANVRGRILLSHEDEGYSESGFAGSLVWNEDPNSKHGFKFSLSQTVGGSATGGTATLFSRDTLEGLAANDNSNEDQYRLDATLGYGFAAFGGRFLSTPEIGYRLLNSGYEYGLGWRLGLIERERAFLELALEGTLRESANDDVEAERRMQLGLRGGW